MPIANMNEAKVGAVEAACTVAEVRVASGYSVGSGDIVAVIG